MKERLLRRISSRVRRQLAPRAGGTKGPGEAEAEGVSVVAPPSGCSRIALAETADAKGRAGDDSDVEARCAEIEWFHSIDLGGVVTRGVKSSADLECEFSCLGLERALLDGRTVLDVGTADGWNALRCESLGASVTAVDGVYRDGLRLVRRRLQPKFHFYQMEVNGPSFLELGQFDVVLYLGVLYHTAYPYDQMVRVAGRCRDTLFLESAYLNLPGATDLPTLTFNFDGQLTADLSSPVFPSVTWITKSLSRLGFRQVDVLRGGEGELGRVIVRARDRDPQVSPLIYAAEQVHV